MKFDSLDKEMRSREIFHGLRVPPDNWAVLRIDGRKFSHLTQEHFEKPFDLRFHQLMASTASRLMEELGGIYGYTESDEISILLAPDSQFFDRELEKLVSVSASIASASFTLAFGREAHFDSRIWTAGRFEPVADYFSWRQADCTRCCLNGWAYWMLRRDGLSAREATRKLEKASRSSKNELLFAHGTNFNDLPLWQRRGTGLYWEEYQKEGFNPKTGETVMATRSRLKVDRELPMKEEYREMLRAVLGTAGSPPPEALITPVGEEM